MFGSWMLEVGGFYRSVWVNAIMKILRFVLVLAFILALPLYSIFPQGASVYVKAAKIYGSVFVERPGQTGETKIKEGELLEQNCLLRTDSDSYVELELNPGNKFRVLENSQVMVKYLEKETQDVDGAVVKLNQFDLLEGDVIFRLDKLPKDTLIQVSSPTAVAGARGTAFGVKYNPREKLARVGVIESNVRVASLGEPDKFAVVPPYKKVTVTPWAMATAIVRGSGVLSEAILGARVSEKAESPVIQVTGIGDTEEDAKLNGYYKISRQIAGIPVGQGKRIEDLLNINPAVCQPLYSYILKAEVVKIQTINNKIEVTLRVPLAEIAEIIKFPLPDLPRVVEEIPIAEYGRIYGALARVTTQRAAQLDGYRKLAELMYGVLVNSKTTLYDMAVADDRITTRVEGVVKGAEIIDTQYFSDGSVSVSMTIRADLVRTEVAKVTGDIFGINYFTSPAVIEMDDFVELY